MNHINKLIHMWDLGETLRNEKLSILMKWKGDIEKEEFETVFYEKTFYSYIIQIINCWLILNQIKK
ncbi:hypothetical protein CN292_26905 [Bacillus cereus]|nr:hypothetical protein CN534_23910 [Bacillus cereus]PEZ54690.1 hypothetical protein CN370_27420 [Bacillus cereus]PFB62363.1 hypothetical protein CN292_26905 [Bacillus cereus]